MQFYNFEIVVEKEPEDEGYLAYSPTLSGVFSNGRTIEDARSNIRAAIQQHLAALQALGQPTERQVAVTVPMHTGVDMGRGLAVRILKDAGFSVEEYIQLR